MGEAKRAVLNEIVRRPVEVAQPEKIIRFGSAALGEMGLHSAVDLLVVESTMADRGHLAGDIQMNLMGAGEAVDVSRTTPQDIEVNNDRESVVWAVSNYRRPAGTLPAALGDGQAAAKVVGALNRRGRA